MGYDLGAGPNLRYYIQSENLIMKRVYYVTNLTITAYRWQANTITDAARFTNDDTGLEQLSDWLKEQPCIPGMILCDVIEEEFTQGQVPVASGSDLKKILQRKLKQAFRGTPFRLFRKHKKKPGKKNPLKINYSAITNPGLLTALLEVLEKAKIPVSGIYTPANLTSVLFKKLKCQTQYNLLVSQQDSQHMRLSFCEQEDLISSRLSNTEYVEETAYFLKARNEAEKNQRYLKRMQLLPQAELADVYIIGEAGMEDYCHEAFKEQYQGSYHYLTIHELCKLTGLKNKIRANQIDMLFVHLLCNTRVVDNYSPLKEKKYHYLSNANKVLKFATIAGVVLALSASVYNVMKGMEHAVEQKHENSNLTVLLHNLSLAKKMLPVSSVSASKMRAFVKAGRQLRTFKVDPVGTLSGISETLTNFNKINIDELSWKVTRKLPLAKGQDKTAPMIGVISNKRYQIITIKGHLIDFDGNYQSAQRNIRSLLVKMRKTGNFIQVQAIKMPVNVDSSSVVSGQSGSGHNVVKAQFTLILVKQIGIKKS